MRDRIRELRSLRGAPLSALAALIIAANEGRSGVSEKWVAQATAYGRKTIRHALGALELAGYAERWRRYDGWRLPPDADQLPLWLGPPVDNLPDSSYPQPVDNSANGKNSRSEREFLPFRTDHDHDDDHIKQWDRETVENYLTEVLSFDGATAWLRRVRLGLVCEWIWWWESLDSDSRAAFSSPAGFIRSRVEGGEKPDMSRARAGRVAYCSVCSLVHPPPLGVLCSLLDDDEGGEAI